MEFMYQGKKEEEDSAGLKMHQFKDSKTTLKKQTKTNYSLPSRLGL